MRMNAWRYGVGDDLYKVVEVGLIAIWYTSR